MGILRTSSRQRYKKVHTSIRDVFDPQKNMNKAASVVQ